MTGTPASAGCVFCEIAAGRRPASQVYADDDVLAFLDIRPVNQGHLLVIPRGHASGLGDLDPELGAKMFRTAQRLAAAVRASGLPCEGINLMLADGAVAGQDVFHVHLHVVPRTSGDGYTRSAHFQQPGRGDLDATAALIRTAGQRDSTRP
jgi:diadenosine tetraphosphate (Ap4A) HIT family hydrolase